MGSVTGPGTDLGAVVRAWRDRLSPAAAGLPARHSRRTAGLRREELAELTGISVDYVVRLEQGRATTPSAQVLASLARALQLTTAERDREDVRALVEVAPILLPGPDPHPWHCDSGWTSSPPTDASSTARPARSPR